jgi:hypothetical protein
MKQLKTISMNVRLISVEEVLLVHGNIKLQNSSWDLNSNVFAVAQRFFLWKASVLLKLAPSLAGANSYRKI